MSVTNGVTLYGPWGIAGGGLDVGAVLAAQQIKIDALLNAPFYVPGQVDVVAGQPIVTYHSRWGVRDDGTVYFDPAGAKAGEEAILTVEDGDLKLTRLEKSS